MHDEPVSRRGGLRRAAGMALAVLACALSSMAAHADQSSASPAGAPEFELNAPAGLLASDHGRQLLRYIVQCALPEKAQLKARVGADVHAFAGALGLAPLWARGALSDADQRWVSACVLARVNFFGVPVPISLQGDHALPDLRTRGEESRDFAIEEGAFYGNLFVPEPVAYTCQGKGPMSMGPWVQKRVCTVLREGSPQVTRCDFILTGACSEVCASRDEVSGAYRNCKAPDGRVYAEVLTTYLRQN